MSGTLDRNRKDLFQTLLRLSANKSPDYGTLTLAPFIHLRSGVCLVAEATLGHFCES